VGRGIVIFGEHGKGGDVVKPDLARTGGRAALIALAGLTIGLCATTSVGAAPGAHAARRHSLHVNDRGRLHLSHKSGNTLYESGSASGTLPGSVSAVFHTSVTKVTGTVTFHSRRGSITMSAVGYPNSAGTVVPFSGNLAVRSGTGAYRSALGSGSFSGTVNRRSWAISVHAKANVTY
jgi:hypothetical protein